MNSGQLALIFFSMMSYMAMSGFLLMPKPTPRDKKFDRRMYIILGCLGTSLMSAAIIWVVI